MKRTPLNRTTPLARGCHLRRTPMKRKAAKREAGSGDWFAAVASLGSCVLCSAFGVQVAHRNEGKGMGMKTGPHMTAALCLTCHTRIDSGTDLTRDERRALMDRAIVLTHDALVRCGLLEIAA